MLPLIIKLQTGYTIDYNHPGEDRCPNCGGKVYHIDEDDYIVFCTAMTCAWRDRTFYPKGDIESKNNMWWSLVFRETKWNLLSNASWSGTRVAGDSIKYTDGRFGCSKERIANLGTEEKNPDIIIIYLGINDFLSCRTLGDWHEKHGTLEYGETIDTFSEGYALMLKGIKEQYPDAEVMCCTLFPSIGQYVLPTNYTNLEGTSLAAYNYVIKEVANYYKYDVINLYDCGINVGTMQQYTIEGLTHPNVAGMKKIRAKMISELDKIYIRKYK
jgi:lysophospholipase L1-like esterase